MDQYLWKQVRETGHHWCACCLLRCFAGDRVACGDEDGISQKYVTYSLSTRILIHQSQPNDMLSLHKPLFCHRPSHNNRTSYQ